MMQECGVDLVSSLPCDRVKHLVRRAEEAFFHVPLTREEEGVGISAGAALAGRRPAMIIQNSGIGNMINALLSLTSFYGLPLALFLSHRGMYRENIAAQVPMGRHVERILKAAGIGCTVINKAGELKDIGKPLEMLYKRNRIHAFLLSPRVWEEGPAGAKPPVPAPSPRIPCRAIPSSEKGASGRRPRYTRYEIIRAIAPFLKGKAVVCNLGFPARELFHIFHQPSNFYMLGSMGMATPVGLGMALSSDRDVVVIDGDGSLLMNPGTLATVAHFAPENLVILAIDNGAYGSTGNQPTLTRSCVDLEMAARGFGLDNACSVSGKRELAGVLEAVGRGPAFIHIRALPGNAEVPVIPLHHLENRRQVMDFLQQPRGYR